MNRRFERDIKAWLEAEVGGVDARADEALGLVFGHLERRGPRAGFSQAVLAAAGFVPVDSRAPSPWLRVAVVGCMVSACLAILAAPLLLMGLDAFVHVAAWPLLTVLWRGAVRVASFAIACWSIIGDVATALRLSIATPTGASIILGNLFIAAASLVGLKRLLASSRSFSNAS